jgi:hypothetical protein
MKTIVKMHFWRECVAKWRVRGTYEDQPEL